LEPTYRIEEVTMFVSKKRDSLIQKLIDYCKFNVDPSRVFLE